MSTTTAPATPHPELPAGTLNQLVRAFLGSAPTPLSIALDGRAFGAHVMVDGERVDIDNIVVRARDLWFIHSVDAARFGSLDECEICREDMAAADPG